MCYFRTIHSLLNLKLNTFTILNTKFATHKLHNASSYFWPNFLHLRSLSTKIQEEKYNVLNLEGNFTYDEESGPIASTSGNFQGEYE
jgi:hypothetical protein